VGDEGKGKITDLLSKSADIVVRYQGVNAGHTIVVQEQTFKLHLIPSICIQIPTVLLLGTVIDPEVLIKELDQLEALISQLAICSSPKQCHDALPPTDRSGIGGATREP